MPQKFPMILDPSVTCEEATEILKREGFDQMPVVGEKGLVWSFPLRFNPLALLSFLGLFLLMGCYRTVLGMVTEGNLMSCLVKRKVAKSDPVSKVR